MGSNDPIWEIQIKWTLLRAAEGMRATRRFMTQAGRQALRCWFPGRGASPWGRGSVPSVKPPRPRCPSRAGWAPFVR